MNRLACALLALAWAMPALAEKTDVIVLVNGDRITGEVKQLSYGLLEFKTDDIGTLSIEWDKVRSVTTIQQLQVEMVSGERYYGRNVPGDPEPGSMRFIGTPTGSGPEQEYHLKFLDIARINIIDSGNFLDRIDGSVSVGYSFAQSTGVSVFNLSASVQSRNRQRFWSVSLDSQLSDQDAGPSSERWSLVGTVSRPMKLQTYYREVTASLTSNDELGLDLRGLVSAGVGRFLHVTPVSEWRAGVGLAGSRERGTDGTDRTNLELQLGSNYRLYRLDTPKSNVTASLTVLPSLSDWGRWRGEASLDLRREFIKDLFFEISVYDSLDNRPADGASTNDWGVTTSIGYTF
jgi:hypothetical protein